MKISLVRHLRRMFLAAILIILIRPEGQSYPIDGYTYTGIKRLMYQYRLYIDSTKRSPLKNGAKLMMEDIQLQLLGDQTLELGSVPSVDAELQKEITNLFRYLEPKYSISVLEFTPGENVRYAEIKPHAGYQPGSVGKLAVINGIFQELAKVYGNDWEGIRDLLKTKNVRAGDWAIPNHHTVPFYDVEKDHLFKRHVQPGDVFTLYEWIDHMVSVSSNAAATIVWREAMLIRKFGKYYKHVTQDETNHYWKSTPRSELSDIAISIVNDPLRAIGIGHDEWRLGSFFTKGASHYVPPKGGSIGTTRGLIKFFIALEKGVLANERISLEMKRLLYLTDRRIRYAASSALNDDAVYFKSGSLYSCQPEPGYSCVKYKGNRYNYMNSVIIVEKPNGTRYMVGLMSNVLKKNSANEHYALASQIDKILTRNRIP